MENDVDEPEDQSGWCYLPDIILERVFAYLSIRERYWASMVCRRWNTAFYLPYAWRIFVFDEQTLTRRRFNYYSGWQHTLDHLRAQMCLGTVGKNFRVLIFTPMTNFYNMYEFMNMISFYAEQGEVESSSVKVIGSNIKTLRYIFPCKLLSGEEESVGLRLYGTGGKLLAAVKRLMGNLKGLQRLELVDLMLDNCEALNLLDEVCCESCTTLTYLCVPNITKHQCKLLHIGVFLNLQVLVVSPQNLGDDIVDLLSFTKIQHIHVQQSRLTPLDAIPVSPKTWKIARKRNSVLRVHLTLQSKTVRALLWQEMAPVASILIDSPQSKMTPEILNTAMLWYGETLSLFGYVGVPRYFQPKYFNERTDPLLLMLVKECPRLNTLIVRERISTCTVYLLAEHGKYLRNFYVRKNAVILRCDWPKNPSWDSDYYKMLRKISKSYDLLEQEVSKIFGYRWRMLPDKEFVALSPKLY